MLKVSTLSAVVAAAAILVPTAASAAGRHPRHSRAVAPSRAHAQARSISSRRSSEDFTLTVVSATMPYDDGTTVQPYVTLVVENTGSAPAPMSSISVAPRNHLSLASIQTIPSLAPGERRTIRIPFSPAADRNECVSITIDPNPPRAAMAQFYAMADDLYMMSSL